MPKTDRKVIAGEAGSWLNWSEMAFSETETESKNRSAKVILKKVYSCMLQ